MVGQILIYNPATSRDHRPDTFSVSDSDRWPGWQRTTVPSPKSKCATVQLFNSHSVAHIAQKMYNGDLRLWVGRVFVSADR